MSKATNSRPNSQQKKTGMAIISDPIHYKKPTINDMRNDNNNASAFKKPSISELRGAPNAAPMQKQSNNEAAAFKRPTIADMQNIQVEFKVDPTKEDPHYKPYTVEEYRELQQMDEISGSNRGGLGPSFDDEWEKKREMRTRLMQFAQKTKEENKTAIPKRSKPRQEKPKGPSKRDKMKEYAVNIPKPKSQPSKGNEKIEPKKPKQKPAAAKYDINAELQRHAHFVQRVNMLRGSVAKYLD